ncbi:MAG: hypothetical protein JWR00_4652 [Rubritepida sp.]|nr:hypothetical protein [Rubritepida sp.]
MNLVVMPDFHPDPEIAPGVGFRARLLALAALCVLGSMALVGGLALHRATLEQRSIENGALTSARAIIHAADREIGASVARMEALAAAPALRAGDVTAFYDQLVATPLPEGTWFILWDTERQLLNTLRPFGTPLPLVSRFDAESQAAIHRIFVTRQPLISPVVWGVVAQTHVISVGIPVVVDNTVTHLFDTILSDRRISQVLDEQPLQAGWRGTLIDRRGATIAHARMNERPAGRGIPEAWQPRLRGTELQGTFFGERDDAPVLVAFARSPISDWTSVIEVPWTSATAPVRRTVRLLACGGLVLAMSGTAVALLAARGANRPLEALRNSAAQARASQREAEARYRTYWQHTSEALFVLSVSNEGRMVFEGLNPAHERLSGLFSGSVAGREPHDCLPPAVAAALIERSGRCVATGVAVRYDEVLDLPAGRRDWETSLAPVQDQDSGRIVRLLGSTRDVTDRRRSESALRESEERFRMAQDAAAIATWDWDLVTGRVRWTPPLQEVTGTVSDDAGPDTLAAWAAIVHPGDWARVEAELVEAAAARRPFRSEFRIRAGSGVRWLLCRGGAVPADGVARRVLGIATDITATRRAEDAVRGLGGRLLTLQDDERRRIARELHDSTAQILLGASFAAERARAVSPTLTEAAEEAIDETLSLIEEGQREIRTVAYLLHPPLLDEMGLAAALRWYAKGLARRSGLAISVEVAPELTGRRFNRDVESALFRVAQEALANAHRHSGGTKVTIRLTTDFGTAPGDGPRAVLLAVEDDGCGFTDAEPASTDADANPVLFGVGLVGMRERMGQLGGRLSVRRARATGTVVEASLPAGLALGLGVVLAAEHRAADHA